MSSSVLSALHLAQHSASTLTDSPSPISDEYGYDEGNPSLAFDSLSNSFGSADLQSADNFAAGQEASSGPKRRSRRPPNTAERRATHNAVERARREVLNDNFGSLAAALPSMAHVKRPSKSMIVNKSLEFVEATVAREQALIEQNNVLQAEINKLRAQLGMPKADPIAMPPPAMARQKINVSSTELRRDSHSSAVSDASFLLGSSPSSVQSVATPSDDAAVVPSPRIAATPALSSDSPIGQPQALTDANKLPSNGDWGMRAQLQAAAQAAVANANAIHASNNPLSFNAYGQQHQHQQLASQLSLPTDPNGLDLGQFLAMQQQHHASPFSLLNGMGLGNFGAISSAGLGAFSQPASMPALSGFAGPNAWY